MAEDTEKVNQRKPAGSPAAAARSAPACAFTPSVMGVIEEEVTDRYDMIMFMLKVILCYMAFWAFWVVLMLWPKAGA